MLNKNQCMPVTDSSCMLVKSIVVAFLWLHYKICSYCVSSKITFIPILKLINDFNILINIIDGSCSRDKVSYVWSWCAVNKLCFFPA